VKNVKASLILLFSQLIYAIFSVIWIITAIMSVMIFNEPEAFSNAQALLLFFYTWLYPFVVIGASIFGWILYHKRKFKVAVWIGLIPLLWVLPMSWYLFI